MTNKSSLFSRIWMRFYLQKTETTLKIQHAKCYKLKNHQYQSYALQGKFYPAYPSEKEIYCNIH